MSIVQSVKQSIAAQVALKLGVLLLGLMVIAASVITYVQEKQMEEATMEKARLTVTMAARQYGELFDNAIDSGMLSVSDVFDTDYAEIKGWNWGAKPKFHTRYDSFTDRAVIVFQEKIMEHEEFVYAVGLDVNGYVPTHNIIGQRPLDGSDKDVLQNRTKRLFYSNDTEVNRSKNTEPFLLQTYHRDTGEMMWDASAPIWVKGKHWGAFVLGVSMKKLEARKRALLFWLVGAFTLFIAVTLVSIFVMVKRTMRPVVALAATADQISVGDGLEQPIKSTAIDEIGVLTKSVDRMRTSLLAAMRRLSA